MDITYIPPYKQGSLVLYSILIGFAAGFICDIVKFTPEMLKKALQRKGHEIFCIILDIIFDILSSIIHTMIIIVTIYALNEGFVRYFLLLSALFGAVLYRISVGKLLNNLNNAVFDVTCKAADLICETVLNITYPIKAGICSRRTAGYVRSRICKSHRR